MSAPRCKCGCKKSQHAAESENYDAPQPCQNPECPLGQGKCEDYDPEEDEQP